MSTPVFSATGVLRSIKPQKRNPLNHCCLMNGGLISSQFPTGTSTGARCSAAPNTRRCGSPALTATSRVGQQTGHWGPNPLRGFWDTLGCICRDLTIEQCPPKKGFRPALNEKDATRASGGLFWIHASHKPKSIG